MTPERREPYQFTLEGVIRLAKEVALEHGGHVPTLIVEGSDSSVIGQMADFPDTHEARRRWMFSAGFALAQSGQVGALKQIFFVSEGWMSLAAEDGTVEVPPSQDPDRKEVLFISTLKANERRTDLVLFEMVRDDEGRLTELKRLQQPGEEEKGYVDSPLLAEFVSGFRSGIRAGLS